MNVKAKTRVAAAICAALILIPGLAMGQAFSWYVDDGPDVGGYIWSDTAYGPFWEWMGAAAFGPDCVWTDLPDAPTYYWACSDPQFFDYSGYEFWADIYLGNNWPDHSNPVTVTLGTGVCGDAQTFVAFGQPVTVNVVDYDATGENCGFLYRFDFGIIGDLILNGESLIMRIGYTGEAFDTHIYWDSDCCPTALHCEEGTAADENTWSAVKALY